MSRSRYWIYMASQYVTLAVVASIAGLDLYRSGGPWWLVALLSGGLAVLYSRWPERHKHAFLAVETLLAAGLMVLNTMAMLLFFTLAVHAVMLFPNRTGAVWIAVFVVISGALMLLSDGPVDGLFSAISVALGISMFGFFTYSRIESESAGRKTQALLAELQEAHRQLQAYAEQVEAMAVIEERNRLARDLHDTLGHRLTVASVQLEGAQRLIPVDPSRAAHMVGTVREQVSEALSELRQTVGALRSPADLELSLAASLRRLMEGFEEATGMRVHLALPSELPPMPETHRVTLYRAAQEGLTNVQRHAQTQESWIEVSTGNGMISLAVRDRGTGIPDLLSQPGFGLRGLRERAEQLGGSLRVETDPAGGTIVNLSLPLVKEEAYG